MPLFYPLGVMQEHKHTREKAGLFDISHMVHIEVCGKEASLLIEHACPYAAGDQPVGTAKYTFFLTPDAGIIDDLIITRLDEKRYLIVANAGCAQKDIAHIKHLATKFDVTLEILERAFVALQGPKAEAVMTDLGYDLSHLEFMTGFEPKAGWFISRTGYTGEDGFEIGLPVPQATEFIQTILEHQDVEWIGLGARDSLRLEAGLSLYGQDLDETITPHEAGLLWAIPKELRDNGNYIGASALKEKIHQGRNRKRVGLVPTERIPVRAGAKLMNGRDEPIGVITSGGFGPSLNGPMALALIKIESDETEIFADVRGKKIPMTVVSLPFIPHHYKK